MKEHWIGKAIRDFPEDSEPMLRESQGSTCCGSGCREDSSERSS